MFRMAFVNETLRGGCDGREDGERGTDGWRTPSSGRRAAHFAAVVNRCGSMMGRGVARFVLVCAVFAPTAVFALDGSPTPSDAPISERGRFASPQQAFRRGVEAYRSGDVEQSVPALKYAAEAGHPLAQWKLAKMYADGDGVPHDDYKAYQYYSRVVENFDEDAIADRDRSVVSNAFVACGVYAMKGIAQKLRPDPQRAFDLFRFAATNFGDANAQYHLARMLLDGVGVGKNTQQAVRWLSLAADKNHVAAQALLGRLLFNGQDGLARQRARGLMWLELALRRADPAKDKWIFDAYDEAAALASEFDRDASKVFAQRFEARGD